MTGGGRIGVLEPGRSADFVALDFSPLANIGMLQDRSHIRAVHIAGKEIRIVERGYDPRQVTDFALSNWTELYTRARVAELNRQAPAARRRIVWKPWGRAPSGRQGNPARSAACFLRDSCFAASSG